MRAKNDPRNTIKSEADIISTTKRQGYFIVDKRERGLLDMCLSLTTKGALKQITHKSRGSHAYYEPVFSFTSTFGINNKSF